MTATHVLFRRGLELYDRIATLTSFADNSSPVTIDADCAVLRDSDDLKKHDRADVAVLKIAHMREQNRLALLTGVTMETSPTPGGRILGLPIAAFRRFDNVNISNRAILFSYPGTSLGRNNQIDHRRPLLRQGMIAGKTEDGRIVLDCPSYFGSSGGLVVEIVEVAGGFQTPGIGVLSEQVPFVEELWSKQYNVQTGFRFENSGYSIAEPIDRVEELLNLF